MAKEEDKYENIKKEAEGLKCMMILLILLMRLLLMNMRLCTGSIASHVLLYSHQMSRKFKSGLKLGLMLGIT